MELLTSGRDLMCKELQGGIAKLWLLPYTKWMRSQVKIVDSVLTLVPSSDYYLFEGFGDFAINQTMQENEGGKFYNFSFDLKLDNYFDIGNFLNLEFRAVALDRIGNTRMYGLWNGIKCESVNFNTGGAKVDFNGYTLSFEGQEILEAPYLNVTILNESYLLQESGDYLLQENLGKFII